MRFPGTDKVTYGSNLEQRWMEGGRSELPIVIQLSPNMEVCTVLEVIV